MWSEGKSASYIAKELGDVTRNAVIGKVHRMGLSHRSATTAKTVKEKQATKVIKSKSASVNLEDKAEVTTSRLPIRKLVVTAAQPLQQQSINSEISQEALANIVVIEKTAKRLNLMELNEKTCKWPIGDPATEEFWFCGLNVQYGKPYCQAHNAIAFQPMSQRRDRRTR